MKIILPFKKDVLLKDNVYEITSISLENQLSVNDYLVQGTLYVTGEYRVSDASNTVLPFNLDLPVSISLDDNYDTSCAKCDIDDFYYEIIDNQKISISVDISVDRLKQKEIIDNKRDINVIEDRCIDIDEEIDNKVIENNMIDNDKENIKEISNKEVKENNINSLFDNLDNSENYKSYLIYIIRENDTIDNILEKYNVDMDIIKEYNDISDIKVGDKIIIPSK